MSVQDQHSSWAFITPIYNLELTDAVKEEFEVERVTFISSDKLRRIRDRLGIKKKYIKEVSERMASAGAQDLDTYFGQHKTFAVFRQTGKPKEIKSDCYRRVQDELSILALSQLYFQSRRYTGFVELAGEHDRSAASHIFLDSQSASCIKGNQLLRSPQGLKLDQEWVDYHRNFFFFRLLKILNAKIKVSRRWRDALRRACILIGKSINTNYVADAFLWNMIALELLLTRQGDSYSTAIPKRMQALIGWCQPWSDEDYEAKIEAVYKLRCQYVHDGDSSKISKDALLFTDKLVFNTLWNLVAFSSKFGSKDALIEFSDKAEARRLLGFKQPTNPKLKFADQLYTPQDLEDV